MLHFVSCAFLQDDSTELLLQNVQTNYATYPAIFGIGRCIKVMAGTWAQWNEQKLQWNRWKIRITVKFKPPPPFFLQNDITWFLTLIYRDSFNHSTNSSSYSTHVGVGVGVRVGVMVKVLHANFVYLNNHWTYSIDTSHMSFCSLL